VAAANGRLSPADETRLAGTRSREDVLDQDGAGGGAVALPQFPTADDVTAGEKQRPVDVGEGDGSNILDDGCSSARFRCSGRKTTRSSVSSTLAQRRPSGLRNPGTASGTRASARGRPDSRSQTISGSPAREWMFCSRETSFLPSGLKRTSMILFLCP